MRNLSLNKYGLIWVITAIVLGYLNQSIADSPAVPARADNEAASDVRLPHIPASMRSIRGGTIGATDGLERTEQWYRDWLGYKVVERGVVDSDLAAAWGAPAMADRKYIVMQPESGADVYIRAVDLDAVEDYRAMRSRGWGALELVVEDPYRLAERLKASPFQIIGEPQPILEGSSIHALQVLGPSDEVLYLTTDIEQSGPGGLPPAAATPVDRIFIVVLAGRSVTDAASFYRDRVGIVESRPVRDYPIGVIARAQGLEEDHVYPLGFMALAEPGYGIEIDGYPEFASQPRPRDAGALPPGVAMVSFVVESLDSTIYPDLISAPVQIDSIFYGGARSAVLLGPAGELIELIEKVARED